VTPGGDGFECPASGCKSVFDTAEEALEHGATHGLSGEREVDDEGKSCCLWQGCGKKVKVVCPSRPKPDFGNLRVHEALHTKGPKPREGFVCPECDEAYPTSAAAWACAATHDVEEDPKKCLWAGCGLTFRFPSHYRDHEPVRVPAPAHGGVASHAAPPEPPRPPPACVASLGLPSHARSPRRVAGAHGSLAVQLHHVQQGPQACGCAPRRATHPMRSPTNETPHPLACPWQSGRRSAARSPPRASAAGARRGKMAQGTSRSTRRAAAAARRPSCWAEPADAAACRWGCRPRTVTSHDAARAATRPPRARAPHEGRA
jgi:hypothetical protein